jgi:hypothetical protein
MQAKPATPTSTSAVKRNTVNGSCQQAGNAVLQAVLSEVTSLYSSLAQPADSSSTKDTVPAQAPTDPIAVQVQVQLQSGQHDPSSLQQAAGTCKQQQLSMLLFDLVLLESWLSCADQAGHATGNTPASPPAAGGLSAAAAVVGSCAATAVGQIAAVMLTGLQQLLQPCPQSHPRSEQQQAESVGRATAIVDIDLIEQVLTVLSALLTHFSTRPADADGATAGVLRQQAAPGQAVLACLELLLASRAVATQHQVSAVQLLPQLLQQPRAATAQAEAAAVPAQLHSSKPSPYHTQQQAVSVLQVAAASTAAEVRAAATDVASQVAHAAMQAGLHQHDGTTAGQLLLQCAHVLASRTQDVDTAVAASAQAALAQLALPLYLLSLCSSDNRSQLSVAVNSTDTHSADVSFDSAGVGSRWRRIAALQPQQRAFKAAQLAQLFDVSFHASPGMLQRYSLRAPQQQQQLPPHQQQPPHLKLAAHDAALYRLAQCLPLLPGSTSSSGSSAGIVLRFEDLSSAAVTSWLLTQEGARQCVSARMRTHLGNPTQSFGALERVVQALLQQLQGDESPQALQRAWQRQLLQHLQAAIPQQQATAQQASAGPQAEPQQLLQAPGAAAGAAAAAHAAQRRPWHQQHTGARAPAADAAQAGVAAAAAEEARFESEAAVVSLLDFMHALEMNVQAAIEGSMMRPAVSKSVMAFFAGNKKVGGLL